MLRVALIVVVVVFVVPTSTAEHLEEVALEFGLPADARGTTSVGGAGPGYVFSTDAGGLSVEAESVQVFEERYILLRSDDPVSYTEIRPIATRDLGTFTHANIELQGKGGWGMSWDSSHWNLTGPQATIPQIIEPGENESLNLPSPYVIQAHTPQERSLQVLAQEATHLEWGNTREVRIFGLPGSMTHDGGREELYSGGTSAQPLRPQFGIDQLIYLRLAMDGATITAHGNAVHGSFVSARLDLNVNGTLTLPQTDVGDADVSLVEDGNGTWQTTGNILVNSVRPHPESPGRAHGVFEGEVSRIAVDGNEVDFPQGQVAVAAGSVLGVFAAWLALKGFGGFAALFTRLTPAQALEHDRRRKLHEYIKANPGPNFREVVRETGIPAGTCRHHLNVLRRSDLIVEKQHGATVRFFENHGRFEASWECVAVLREPDLEQVHTWLKKNPGVMQKEYLEHAETEWGWSRSTAQHRLKRLRDSGLVEVKQFGRSKRYEARDDVKPDTPFHPLTWRG